jgi:DNA-binding HxlR family transcriptional regulator
MSGKADSKTTCSIASTLEVVGEKWTPLILREAFAGASKFSEFRDALPVASDVLSDRLRTLVDNGVLERRPYREDGARERFSYHLTESGRELLPVLGALMQWGDAHRPPEIGGYSAYVRAADATPLKVVFVAESGEAVDLSDVRVRRRREALAEAQGA